MICRSLSATVAAAALILPVSINSAPVNPQVKVQETPVFAHGYGRHNRGRDGDSGDRWLQELNLTLEQSERIKAIKEQSWENMSSLKEQMGAAREEMRSLMAGTGTPQQLRQQHQQIQGLRNQLSNQRFETILAIREVLTPQQRNKMAELIEQRDHRKR